MTLSFTQHKWIEKFSHSTACAVFCFVLVFVLCSTFSHAAASDVTLAWDPNPEPDIAGYKVHYGTYSRLYNQTIDVGNWTSCIVSGLQDGKTYYISVTAYDTSGNESAYSGEITYRSAIADSSGGSTGASGGGGGGGGGCFIAAALRGL